MFTKILNLSLVIVFGCCLLSAQTSKKSVSDETWEYLIVSNGNFGDKEKLNVTDKWLGRRQGNAGFYQFAAPQNEFDRLGKLGWELVGIVPGGAGENPASIENSRFIFKRQFDAVRSARETEEAKQLANETKIIQPDKGKTENLVELDRAELVNKRKETAENAKTNLEQIINNPSIVSIQNVETQYPNNTKLGRADIIVDGSAALLKDGNKYRLSEAKKYARQIAAEIFNKVGLRQVSPSEDFFSENGNFSNRGGVLFRLSVVINHNGAAREVAGGYITGNWIETIK